MCSIKTWCAAAIESVHSVCAGPIVLTGMTCAVSDICFEKRRLRDNDTFFDIIFPRTCHNRTTISDTLNIPQILETLKMPVYHHSHTVEATIVVKQHNIFKTLTPFDTDQLSRSQESHHSITLNVNIIWRRSRGHVSKIMIYLVHSQRVVDAGCHSQRKIKVPAHCAESLLI